MNVLPLDSARWAELRHAYGPAADTPRVLRALEAEDEPGWSSSMAEMRDDPSPWEHIFTALLHQGSLYSATFAAAPHLVRIADERPSLRDLVLSMFCSLRMSRQWMCERKWQPQIPKDIVDGFIEANAVARGWPCDLGQAEEPVRTLSGYMSLRGHTSALFAIVADDREVSGVCPSCGWTGQIDLAEVEASWTPKLSASVRAKLEQTGGADADWLPGEASSVAHFLAQRDGVDLLARGIIRMESSWQCPRCGGVSTPTELVANMFQTLPGYSDWLELSW